MILWSGLLKKILNLHKKSYMEHIRITGFIMWVMVEK